MAQVHSIDHQTPLSALSGGRFQYAVEARLRAAALRHGFRSRFWVSAAGARTLGATLRNRNRGVVLRANATSGAVAVLRAFAMRDIEETDAHFFMLQNPPPTSNCSNSAAHSEHFCFTSAAGAWEPVKDVRSVRLLSAAMAQPPPPLTKSLPVGLEWLSPLLLGVTLEPVRNATVSSAANSSSVQAAVEAHLTPPSPLVAAQALRRAGDGCSNGSAASQRNITWRQRVARRTSGLWLDVAVVRGRRMAVLPGRIDLPVFSEGGGGGGGGAADDVFSDDGAFVERGGADEALAAIGDDSGSWVLYNADDTSLTEEHLHGLHGAAAAAGLPPAPLPPLPAPCIASQKAHSVRLTVGDH